MGGRYVAITKTNYLNRLCENEKCRKRKTSMKVLKNANKRYFANRRVMKVLITQTDDPRAMKCECGNNKD